MVYIEISALVEWAKDSGLSQRLYYEQPFKWPFGRATAPLLPVTLSNCLSPSFQQVVCEHGTHLGGIFSITFRRIRRRMRKRRNFKEITEPNFNHNDGNNHNMIIH